MQNTIHNFVFKLIAMIIYGGAAPLAAPVAKVALNRW
jgi:hypothetical protein